MKIIYKGRGMGKTTELVKLSAKWRIPIVTLYPKNVESKAKELGLNIPNPIGLCELKSVIGYLYNQTVLVDNAELVLKSLLSSLTMGFINDISAITINNEGNLDVNKPNQTKEEMLKEAARPLVEYLQQYEDSHTTVLVENDHVTLRKDEIGIPFEIQDKSWMYKGTIDKGV